jgi:Flp pilus assembly pilin Flp
MFLEIYPKMIGEKTKRRGQSLTEYALLLVPIALVVIVVVTLLGSSVTNVFCTVTESFTIVDGEPCYETLSQVGDGPVVLRAKYRDTKDGIFLRARTENCSGDLVVVDYGTMDQGGDSNNYSISIVTDTPPPTVMVGSDDCGWTTVSLD